MVGLRRVLVAALVVRFLWQGGFVHGWVRGLKCDPFWRLLCDAKLPQVLGREVQERVRVSAEAEVRLRLEVVAFIRPASAALVFLEDHHPILGVVLGVRAVDELEVAGAADVGDRAVRAVGLASEKVEALESTVDLHGSGGWWARP